MNSKGVRGKREMKRIREYGKGRGGDSDPEEGKLGKYRSYPTRACTVASYRATATEAPRSGRTTRISET